MQGKINFNAGPAALPPEVLHDAAKAIRKYKNTGLSILELPHRGKEFLEILEESKSLVKKLCNLNDDFEVLWLHGGGRLQFCMVPMNFIGKDPAGYIESGYWAADAIGYARQYGDVQVLASAKDSNYDRLPDWPAKLPKHLSYIHITTNNTIFGTQWHDIPDTTLPLIADMSSDIFSHKLDYNKFSLFYAAAQKNLGTAGVALACIRKDFLAKASGNMPGMLSYKEQVKENSILNTANVFGIYVSLLMLRWIKEKGISTIEKENKKKAQMIYDALDKSSIFTPHVKVKEHRSQMNICFTAKKAQDEKAFLALCESHDITGIQGHRSVGGFRASVYNAVSLEAVEQLVHLMKVYETKNS
ncbi:MAG: 3-phosphoserine/phosphohydroxythreonine transaminase [Bacteroidota bacterium]